MTPRDLYTRDRIDVLNVIRCKEPLAGFNLARQVHDSVFITDPEYRKLCVDLTTNPNNRSRKAHSEFVNNKLTAMEKKVPEVLSELGGF